MALLHKRKTKITTVWTDKSSFLQNRVWLPGVKAYFQSAITVQYTYWTLILQLQQLLWEGKGQTLRKDDSCAGLIYKKKHIYLWPRYSVHHSTDSGTVVVLLYWVFTKCLYMYSSIANWETANTQNLSFYVGPKVHYYTASDLQFVG